MKIAIINSKIDIAGCNIRRHLLKRLGRADINDDVRITFGNHSLRFIETEEKLIYQNGLDKRTDCDLIIFISRHSSQNPMPALTVHTTGNYGKAMLGGNDRELATAAPAMPPITIGRKRDSSPVRNAPMPTRRQIIGFSATS